MSYYIRHKDDTTSPVDRANPFIYEEIQLFTWYHKGFGEFQVVESTTGLLLSSKTTEEEAFNEAKEILNKVGIDKVKEKITELKKKFNINILKPIVNMEVL